MRQRVLKSQSQIDQLIAEQKRVYGLNTGFGALGEVSVEPSELERLQRNLIYHLATGVGAPLSWLEARAVVAARLHVLSKGHSGCDVQVLEYLAAVLNSDLAPAIPRKGTVGASGDLTPSAHMALALMGEGNFVDRHGATVSGADGLAKLGLDPLPLETRAGLALVNGTSAMTGIATVNAVRCAALLEELLSSAAAYADIMGARTEAYDPRLQALRGHDGQIAAAQALREKLAGSERTHDGFIAAADLQNDQQAAFVQDPYTLRCLPQAFGAVMDMLTMHDDIVAREIEAVTDNPVLIDEPPFALHGGNFYGQHIGFASDALLAPIISLAVIAERQIARLTDPTFNGELPPFLQPNDTGMNSGFMGAQVTASALVAEMRSRAVPASMQSVPTNGNNQDINTMGTVAARKISELLDDAMAVLSIHALAVAQAVDLAQVAGSKGFAPTTLEFVQRVRSISPRLVEDRPLATDIARAAAFFDPGQGSDS
ncbi:MAG: aromatic amino acid ammonia-lyase [Pseudomonadota bacterium]